MATRKEIAQNQKILYDDAVANNMFQAAVPTFKEFQRRLEGQGYQKMVYDNYKKHNVKGKGFNNLNEFRGAFGGSFYADENKISLSNKAQAVSDSARQTVNNAGRYNRLKQRKQKQQKDFGRVNLGTHLTPFGGDANDVVKDEFAYNPETGKAGAYVTSDNENAYTQSDAEQRQAILDKYGEEWNKAVDMGMVPSELDKADPDMSDTDVAMRQMERRQEWIDENQNRRSKELNESMHLQDSPFVASGGAVAPSSFNTAIGNEANRLSDAEYGAYNTAKAYNQMLRTTLLQELKEQKQRNENAGWWKDKWNDVSNYFGAMFNTMLDPKLYSQGVMDAAIASNLLQVKKGMEDGTIKKGSNAGDATQVMLSAIQQQQGEAAKQYQYGTKAYQYGDVSGRSLKFMADFALSGWRNVMTTGFTKAGEKVGEKMALGALGKWFTKNTGRVLGDMAGSAALAATNQLGSTYNNVIERYVGMNNENGGVTQDKDGDLSFNKGVSLGKAIKDGLGSATIENFSEMFGEYLPGASKILSKLGLSKVSSFFEKIGNNAYYKWLSNATNKSGIQGVMSEIAEEEFGTALHAAWGDGDGSWSDFNVFTNPDAREKQIDTCLGMFYSVGFMQSPRTAVGAINAVKYFHIKLQVTKADKFGQMMFNDKWDDIKSKIDVTTNADLTKTVLDATRSDSMTAKQKGAVTNYAMFLSKLRGFNQASDAKTKDKVEEGETVPTLSNYLDDAYTEGHNSDDADKHDIQIQHEDQAKTLAAALNISEQQLSGMSDEELESLTGQDDKLDQAIYDYQLSSARYQGVVDDAQDKVDLAAHQAEQRVNMYTDQSRGSVRNATIKASGGAEDYGVYIISGNIATHEDGSIDVSNSDDMILYFDPTTNSVEHADALMFAELGEELPADAVKAQAVADAKENAIKEVAGIIDGTVEVGSQFSVTDADGTEHTYEVLADNGDGTAMITIDGNVPTELVKGENVQIPYSFEDLQKMKDLEDQKRLETAKAQREQMEKERAEQQNQAQTTQAENPAQESNTQSAPIEDNLDYSDIIREDGRVQMVDVSDKDGNNLFPDAKDVFYIQGNKMRTKFAYIDANGELKTQGFPTGLVKIKTRGEVSVDDYKKYRNTILAAESSAMPESSMIEGNSGENRGGIEAEPTTIEDETTPDVAENTETTAPAEENAEETEKTPTVPAITLEDGTIVPMLEDGNPDFSKLTAAQTAELYDSQFGEDADGIVSGYVSDAKKALDKANNITVKGKTFVEQKAAKTAKEKAIADAQAAYDSAIAIRDAYNERQLAKEENTPEGRKSLIEKAKRKFTRLKNTEEWSERTGDLWNETVGKLLHRLYDATGIDVFDDTPNTVYEYVAENVGPYSLNYEGNDNSKGVQQETGLSRSDFAKLGWLAAEGKGMTIDAKVHRLWENRPSNLESADTQDIRNALISLITSGQTAFQARDYILNQRIELAESALEEQLRQEEDAAEAQRAKEEEEKKKAELEKKKAEEEKTNENRNAPELSREQQKAMEEGEKLGFPAFDKEGEPINQNVIELANWAKKQGLEIDPTSKLNSYADLYVMCKGGFGVSTLVPDVGEDINQVFYFPDNVQGEQLSKLQEEFNAGRDLKHSADMNSELTEGAMFYDGDTAREFKEFVDKKVEEQNKVFGEQRPEEDLPFSAKDNGQQQTTSERDADVERNKVDDMKVVDNIVGQKTRKTLERLAKMMGANVQWQYSDKNANGWFDDKTNTIYLTLDSSITEGVQFIFGHEMTHEMRTKNPAAYDELKTLVKDMMGEDAFNSETDRITSLYNENNVFYNGGRTAYEEEVVADQLGKWIRDANYAHTLLLKMSHPLLAKLHEIVNRFLMALHGIEISDDMNLILRSIEQAYVKTAKGRVENSETGEDVSFSLRQKPEPKKKGVGYKVFVLKDGKLYPPMVANPDGAATPVGVWLDADAAPIAGESKTGRPQVKQGGKGTQGGSGKLAYRPGWHLGVVPYAIQFNRKDAEGNKTLFPKNFVFAEVEYAADVDYQEEARQEGINPSGKYQHSLAGLKHLPTDGYYMYRTNPNPETDPWVITGAMKVNRILTRAEQADLVSKAGREPQQIQEGDIVTDDVVNSINQEIAAAPKFSLKVYHGSGADFTEFDFDHMGEGAGSQVFGWGGYVTSSKKIGKSYATLMDNDPSKAYYRIQRSNGTRFAKKYPTLESFLHGDKQIAMNDKFTEQEKIDFYNEMKKLADPYHNLYEVDIPDDNGSNYLDWDAPLSDEQKKTIVKTLKRLKIDFADLEKHGFSLDGSFGDNVYGYLNYALRDTKKWQDVNALRAVSKFLASLGYTGIKYKAGRNFGGAEEGDTNYVIFKPEDMKITEHTKFSLRLKSAIEETETNPSDAQKERGNYKKGHIKFGGYDYTIENPKGSTRSGKDADGKEWKVIMHDTYGYIRGKFGKDGDHLDMFINDKADLDNWNGDVFVVDQVNPDGSFDEHKVMYGYDSMDDAKKAYLANYSDGWQGLGNITGASKDEFDKWLDTSNRKLKPFADYAKVKFSLKDNQGNPLNQDGTLKLDKIKSVDELTDEDFTIAFRNVELPAIPKNVDAAIGANGKPIVIKKNIFEKNWNAHKFTPTESKKVLNDALYNTDLVGHTQPTKKPNHWVAIKLDDKSPITVLEVNDNKDNVEVVGWYTLDERNLGRIKRQAERNGGELIMLTPKDDKVESLSTPPISSAAKIDNSSETAKENGEKFSLKDEKTLAGVHNITEEKLRKALKLGGLANPSLAVIDTSKNGHDNFGEISFIAPSALLDKRTGKTAGTWVTDAYTQRYPSVEREMSEKGYRKFEDWVDSLDYPSGAKAEIERQAKDALSDNNAPAWELMYLKEKGIDIKAYDSNVDYRWKEIISDHPTAEDILNSMKTDPELNEEVISLAKHVIIYPTWEKVSLEVRRKIYKETGVKKSPISPIVRQQTKEIFERDYKSTLLNKDGSPRKKDVKKVVEDIVKEHNDTKKYDFYLSKVKASGYVNKNGLYDDYIRWQEKKLDEFGTKNRIFRGYKPDGTRKYVPETLDNVSKVMREEADGQTNGSEYTSFGSFIAKVASRVDSTDEMRDNKDKLSSNEDKEKFYEKWKNVYYDLAKFLYNDVFYGEQRLHDIVLQSDPKKYAKKEYGITLTPTFMKKLDALKNAVQTELKSAYFETKYNRPLRLNEFAAAVVPDNLGEDVRKGIEDAGLPMYNYDPNKEGDRNRAFNEAVNSSDNIRFSLKEEKEKIVADAKANGTYMTAPNGDKTKLDAEQWVTVRTTNFKNWFGDWENDPENASKVVDENGEPMMVYHGTTNDETIKVWNEKAKTYDTSHEPFAVFKRAVDGLPNSGMFFNSSENNAYEYGYNHYAVYLNAKNPLVIDCKGNLYNSIKYEGKTMDTYDWANWAEENGFDGVIFKNIKDGVDYGSMQNTTDDYVVFYSNQIKSAENNNGDFSADNNDIRFSLRNLDQEYLDAVKKGDMEKAQRLVNKAAAVAGYSTDSSYQGTSAFNGSAPWGNGYFLTKEERKEAWNNGEFEGESTLGDYINDDIDGGNLEALTNTASYRAADPMRKEAIDNVRNAIQKKSKFITMYRSVPSDVKEGSFRNGDWITPSRSYAVDNAKLHGWGSDYNIIEQKVPVDDVWFDGNDIAEWGYGIEKDYINDTDFAYKNVKNNRKLLDVVTYNDNGEVIPLSQRFDPNKSDTRFSLRGSTPYDKQMEEWMEKNHLEKGAVPMEKPIMGEGENIFDYANRMVEWTRNQNLWKTAPKQTGFQDALEKWKADNSLSPDAYPPVRPHRENYSSESDYAEDLEEYNKKKELWKSAPKPKDFDLSVDLEDMNKQLRNIRRAVLNQKNYDQRTVKAVSDLVRKMLNIGWGDGLSRGKVANLLSAAKNATGANDVKKYLDKAMGILAENYLNRLSTAYDNLINTKGARADQSGVIKMGSLDANGQAFMSEYKKAINMDDKSLNNYIANIEDDSAKNEDNVEMNDYRLAGIQAAIIFKQQIGGNDADIAELKRQIGELKNKKDATKEDKDLLKSLEKKLFENKFDRITMYENLLNNIQRMVKESKGRAKEFREEIAEHKNEILHRANLDLEGVDSTYYDTTTAKKKLVNNDLQRAVFSSTYTFEQFLRFFGKHSANGEGRLYNYFHKLNQDTLDEEQLYNEMNRNALDEKTKELFGRNKFMKLVGIDGNGMKEMDIEVTDYSNKKTGKRTIHLKQGQMLYIYLVNKETDGEMKLRAMGITEEDVAAIEENLDPRVKAMGEWLQDEYLPECQRRYQATHTKYFGAPMKEVENYFPLAINNRARNVKEDVNQDSDAMSQLAGTSTGAIVTRRVNVIPLDIENADAFEVAFNHLQEMEEWSAMLPFRQDVNTLLSYTHFRNQVQNMSSVAYGSGKTLWDEFKQTAQIAAGTYKPKVNAGMMDSRIAAAMGGIAVAKISGRLWTAIKQSQSATVFLPECDFTRFVKNGVNPYGSWKWAKENIPDFRKRVENMTYGDVKLRQYLDELEKYHDWAKVISKWGMAPNILVDGITCAVGARSVYETEVNRLTKLGYPKEKAEEKAYYKAVAAYNKTQQSSGGMYLSPMQVDRTYVSAALSLFKNANFAYGRMQIEACRGLARTYDFWGGKHKTTLIESMTRQIMEEDGLDENTARAIAKVTYNRTFRQSIGRLINFATLVPVSWALYKALPYLLTGDDDDKKKDMIEEAVLKGFATSLSDNYVIPFVSNILNAGLKVEDGKPTFDPEVFRYQNLYINPATSDLANIYSMIGNQKWYSVANKFGMLGVQSLIGFNPETVGALYQAFAEADYDNGNTAKEWQIGVLKAISAPEESIRELYMDELGLKSGDKDAMKKFMSLAGLDADDIKKVPLSELEKRYAERQINRDNLLSQIGMDAETFNGYVDKYQKSFEKKIKDKMDKWDEYDKKKADEFFDTTTDPALKGMMEKKRAKDANTAADEQIAKEGLSQENKGKELNEEAYDAVKMSIDVAEDNAISTYNKVLNKRYAALNDEYNEQTDAMKYIFMSKHPNFKAYKDLESEYTTYGKKMKELKEKLVSADGYDAKQTILKQIRTEREKFSELQSKVR